MEPYLDEFITLCLAVLLCALSPGPDWAVVMKHSMTVSRKAGLFCSLGIACGIIFHMTYCLLGIGLLISSSPFLFRFIQYVGALYLAFIGYKGLRSPKVSSQQALNPSHKTAGLWIAFREGLLTNLFNPKATLFFLSLFSVIIDAHTPSWVQLLYSFAVISITLAWFGLLSFILSHHLLSLRLLKVQHWIQRIMGVILILLSFFVAFCDS